MSTNVVPLRSDEEIEGMPLVTPGLYNVVYRKHAGFTIFKGVKKVCVYFQLLAHPGIVLERWYRVASYGGGRISAVQRSDIVREVAAVLGRRIRHDRIPVASLSNLEIVAEVSTVTHDHEQTALHAINQYSVISRLRGRA
jgi:hypothetical protein